MKLSIIIINIFFIASCIELNMADDPPFIYSLNQTFKVQVFIPYYSYFTMVSVYLYAYNDRKLHIFYNFFIYRLLKHFPITILSSATHHLHHSI
jgi:hypothetical protein